MAFLGLFLRRQLPPAVALFARTSVRLLRPPRSGAPLRRLHGASRLRVGEKGPWAKSRGPELQQYQLTDLDKADALMLRKSHETGKSMLEMSPVRALTCQLFISGSDCFAGFLSWFRNGLLATGIGVIAFVQSEVGREAAYAFFILGGVCVSFGGASYVGSLFALRRMMLLLSVPALLLQSAAVGSVALFWLCAVSLYIGRLEVEIIHEDEEERRGRGGVPRVPGECGRGAGAPGLPAAPTTADIMTLRTMTARGPTSRRFAWRAEEECVWLLQCDQHPTSFPSLHSLPQILLYPFALESFFFLDSSSRSRLLPSSSSRLLSVAASDCTGLFGMQEAPEAWRV
ncbi:hypothetical protein L3Q82_018804 [Scortum barcoo]|uniref:Uncharacterized protein n=1 Tax=Scortum barcoo TaxID=214431 RepID=A0ACB8VFI7_9TELE|nr:hypothetical protein L3Q82_018804 [Scortum barcoo]